ncbi:MAG: PD-(D/E)XK nuclease family protein [Ekhidna sp.]|nr:PD-(D/E)XK nuclease family protein [Ekhidna sp.]
MPLGLGQIKNTVLMDIQKLFYELQTYHKEDQENNKIITPDFNVFHILSPKETQLARFIGELLNPKGVHAQGQLFLDQFVDSFFLRKKAFFKNAKSIDISLEYANKSLDGPIDIFMLFENRFAVAIENKPFANGGERQIMRYCDFMAKKYGYNYLMIYLERQGENPTEKSLSKDKREKLEKENKFLVISYSKIRDWINNCIEVLKETGAERLTILLEEFAEHINLEFRKQNTFKNTPMYKVIKNNIIEAHQVISLWENERKKFKKHYAEEVNRLFNEELPKLVYEDLKNRNVIDDDWKYKKGHFDITIKHLQGWLIKKNAWKGSGVGIYSNREGYGKYEGNINIPNYFPRGFFPLILSNTPIKRANYNEDYCNKTGCKAQEEYKLNAQWWSNFPENSYQSWGDEHWKEIKPNGKTVHYVSSFLEKLIKACEADIDEIEKVDDKESL